MLFVGFRFQNGVVLLNLKTNETMVWPNYRFWKKT